MDNKFLITLLNTKNLARKSVAKIIENVISEPCNLEDILLLIEEKKQHYGALKVPSIKELQEGEEKAERIIDKCNELNIHIISCFDTDYPKNFRDMQDAPILLYARGNYLSLNNPSVAVIGTREPSNFGFTMAFRAGKLLAENGIAVVSGLAKGCDTGAHKGCLDSKGFTVAILANGLEYNKIYPKENQSLAREIVESNGCLLSEYEPLTLSNRYRFIERDRLQAGLSKAVFVIETTISGGTMHAVNTCIQEKRILACLKHPEKFRTEKSKGNDKLLSMDDTLAIASNDNINKLVRKIITPI